jgi:glucose uptake protein GlcU
MNLSKLIIGAFLIIGIAGFVGLGYYVVLNNNRNETAMYMFSGLFVAIGSAIAILIDVEPRNSSPAGNGKQGMFNTLGRALTFTDNSRNSNNSIGFGYAISYLLIGVLIVYKLISNDKDDEFLATLSSGFAGLMLAVIGKYAFVKD